MVQVASVIGPAAGGVVIAEAGVAWVYAVNAVSYLVVIARAADDAGREPARTDADGTRVDPAAAAQRLQRRRGARRAALRVPLAAHPLDDAAGFLRDVLLVGDGAAADLRAGRAARRRARVRLALLGAGGRRRARQRGHGARGRFDRAPRHRADRRASRSTASRPSRSASRTVLAHVLVPGRRPVPRTPSARCSAT